MIVPIPWVHAGLGAVVVLISVPLIARKVPMNKVYGIRVTEAFRSEKDWYAINVYGGRLLLAFGVLLLACAVVGVGLAPAPTSPWAPVFIAAPLLALVPIMMRVKAFARKVDGR
jgi:hypothetical protein